jgi:hypothetical protein
LPLVGREGRIVNLIGLRASFGLMLAGLASAASGMFTPKGVTGTRPVAFDPARGPSRLRWAGKPGRAGDKLGRKAFKGQIGIRKGW